MGDAIRRALTAVRPVDAAVAARTRNMLDAKAKPRGSLGRLEEVAVRLTTAGGRRPLRPVIVVAAADHGVAARGVSAYPQQVTRQMVAALADDAAAVCVLARQAGAALVVVDAGIAEPLADARVLDLRLGPGTGDFTVERAMGIDRAVAAVEAGIALADDLASQGHGLVALGEMGIGNTTAAAALAAALLGVDPAATCGRGTGLDDEQLARKVDLVRGALRLHALERCDPLGALAAVGGFELGVLAGVAIGAAAAGMPVVLDGFPSAAAALVAARLAPALSERLIASHRSPEPGHVLLLEALGLRPLLDLRLRLGEGSGAALALPLLAAALAILDEMATFAAAGITDTGR